MLSQSVQPLIKCIVSEMPSVCISDFLQSPSCGIFFVSQTIQSLPKLLLIMEGMKMAACGRRYCQKKLLWLLFFFLFHFCELGNNFENLQHLEFSLVDLKTRITKQIL